MLPLPRCTPSTGFESGAQRPKATTALWPLWGYFYSARLGRACVHQIQMSLALPEATPARTMTNFFYWFAWPHLRQLVFYM
jgi:hypothetical protein